MPIMRSYQRWIANFYSITCNFLHALQTDQALLAHATTGTVVPKKIFNRENLKFGLKYSVWALITSGLVTISSPNFSRPRDELWCTYWPTRSASCTVIWHKSIRHVFLFGVSWITSRHTGVLSYVVLKRRLEVGTIEEMLSSYLDEQYVEERCGKTMLNLQRHIAERYPVA